MLIASLKRAVNMMNRRDELNDVSRKNPKKLSATIFAPQNAVTIYTMFSILLSMKRTLGMEAMLEYMDQYVAIIDKHNPKFKFAVLQALSYMNIEKMYKDVMESE